MANCGNQKKKPSSSIQNIRVVVRVRPLSNEEKEKRVKTEVHCISMREIQTKEKKYQFDRVFEPDSSQMDIYSFVVAPMINDVLAGYNCTVFAYGQTGTGKTHTMTGGDPSLSSGSHWREDELAGCIPRAASNIFGEIGTMKVNDYNVRVSFLELYNEEVRDLLSQEERPPPLNIFNDSKGSVCIQNLNEITVFSSNDIYMLLQQGTLKRQTAATLMNNHSSRSHTVFTITVHTREANLTGEEVLKTGKINLVDLAGSENIAKSGAKDKRALELANINRSLLTLGRVIQILAEKNNKHVPYRDSKLTRILQDSLGGHTKTCIIATVSPSHTSYEETQSTLEYACRARDIRNTPMVNEKVTKAQMMKEMTHEIEKLKKDLDAARTGDGFFIDRMNWEDLNVQLQSSSNALVLKTGIIEDMKKKLLELETIRDIKKIEFEDAMNVCKHKEKIIDKAKALLKEQHISLKQEQYVSKCYLEAATENNTKAKELLEVTKSLSKNQDILQKKLENQYYNNYTNEKIVNDKSTILSNNLDFAMSKLENMRNFTSTETVTHKTLLDSVNRICSDYGLNLKLKWENENGPLMKMELENQSKLIQESAQDSLASIDKSEVQINEMLGLVNNSAASSVSICKDFDKAESLMSNVRSCLRTMRKKKEGVLRDVERFAAITREEIGELDNILGSIENSEVFCSVENTNSIEDSDQKFKFRTNFNDVQQNNQLLSKSLQNTKNVLELQRQDCGENERKLIASNQEIKECFEQIMTDGVNGAEAFVSDSTLKVGAIEESHNISNEHIENHISELRTILQNTDEIKNEILNKIIPVKRAGDTPKQICLNYPKRIGEGALPRDVLIKRFKEEFSEDVVNESFHLNISTESIRPLDVSDDTKNSTEESLDCSK